MSTFFISAKKSLTAAKITQETSHEVINLLSASKVTGQSVTPVSGTLSFTPSNAEAPNELVQLKTRRVLKAPPQYNELHKSVGGNKKILVESRGTPSSRTFQVRAVHADEDTPSGSNSYVAKLHRKRKARDRSGQVSRGFLPFVRENSSWMNSFRICSQRQTASAT